MATRPKQRVLVRWNDDLDKSLLLFITHTCTELGIKIPYDEVARRMGSTFTEGAIQQHISKLRNKMAELNVAPVPAAPKRGAVTVKPSSVYGQKGRAGPAPQQPVASKTQARATGAQSNNDTTTGTPTTTTKRSGRRRQATIKRSESDEGPTDDEYIGASDDDFQPNPNENGKRGRGTERQGPPSKKVAAPQPQGLSETAKIMKALAEADARYDAALAKEPSLANKNLHPMYVQQRIEALNDPAATATTPAPLSHHGQLMQAAGYNEEEEEEEEEQEPTELDASGRFILPRYNPEQFSFIQDRPLSPTSISQMPPQVSPHLQYGGSLATANNHTNNFQQVSRPLMGSQNNGFTSNNSEYDVTNFLLAPQPRLPFQPTYMNSHMPPPYPPATTPAISGYGGIQQPARNDSMGSNSSQNTFTYPPQTPTIGSSAGINSVNQSPFNEWARPDFNNSTIAPSQMASAWGFDSTIGTNYTHDSPVLNDGTIGGTFADQLFS